MQNQIKQGFTLVELIVVITILAILATIGFLSLQGYSANARDGKRVSDIQLIGSSLELFQLNTGKYPEPTNSFEVTYSGSEVRKQGTFGETSFKNVEKLNKIPLDPSTNDEYTYSVLNTRNEYELGSIYESTNLLGRKGLLRETYAGTKNALAMIKGNYNGIFAKVFSGSTTYVLAVPSIINSEIGNVDIIDLIQNKKMVYKGYKNLPSGYKNSDYNINGEEDGDFNIVNSGSILLFSGSVDDFKSENAQLAFISNLQNAYSGTHIKGQADIDNILKQDVVGGRGGALLISQVLIHDHINKEVEIKVLGNGIVSVNNTGSDNSGKLSLGGFHTCIIIESGDLYCWGYNLYGQVGNNSTINLETPTKVLSGVKSVSSGLTHTCAITINGDLYCWGRNNYGQIGDDSLVQRNTPKQILTGVSNISLGGSHTCAVTISGDLKCWGYNGMGQIGDGTSTGRTLPTQILSGISKVSAGSDNTCAITTSGDLKCWGSNNGRKLGDGTNIIKKVPTDILSGITDVDLGIYTTCATKINNDLYCWGQNAYGGFLDGTLTRSELPKKTQSGVSKVVLAPEATCIITTSGDLKCAGDNRKGQLGYGGLNIIYNLTDISTGVSDVSLGTNHGCLITNSGVLKCFGFNNYSQIGNIGEVIYPSGSNSSVYANPKTILNSNSIKKLSLGYSNSCYLTNSGDLHCWGNNDYKKLLDITSLSQPKLIMSGVSDFSLGMDHSCLIKENLDLYCWGSSFRGGVGNGTTNTITTPELILSGVSKIDLGERHTCAIKENGDLYCWGLNNDGEVGSNSGSYQINSPVFITGSIDSVSLGNYHTCGIKTDGDLYCWGSHSSGQMGIGPGNSAGFKYPFFVKSGVSKVDTGGSYTCILTTAGNIECFGLNNLGQLGKGNTTNLRIPTLISGVTGIFSDISIGYSHTCGLKENGDLYCWGYNSKGQLGDGTISTSTSPILISSGISKISNGQYHTCAITTSGDLKCWGENEFGQLGFNPYAIRDININP